MKRWINIKNKLPPEGKKVNVKLNNYDIYGGPNIFLYAIKKKIYSACLLEFSNWWILYIQEPDKIGKKIINEKIQRILYIPVWKVDYYEEEITSRFELMDI